MTSTDKNQSKPKYLEKNHLSVIQYTAFECQDNFCSRLRDYILLSVACKFFSAENLFNNLLEKNIYCKHAINIKYLFWDTTVVAVVSMVVFLP